jgi:predicted nucleic acid-binding protein
LSYLIDTNVLSELKKKFPNPVVVDWFESKPASILYISVLTLGEIRKGVDAIADDQKRQVYQDWLETELPVFFVGRVLPITAVTSDYWGKLMAQAKRPLPTIDSLLAASALEHRLTLVTRNTKDFSGLPLDVFNPWDMAH